MAAERARHRGTAAAEAPPPLPPEGTVVDLRLVDRARPAWTTRVEVVDGWALSVVAPLRPDGEPWPIPEGTTVAVGWPTDLGFLEAGGSFREVRRDAIATWVVDVRRVERRQRRGAYRLPLTAPVTLRVGGRAVVASTCDVSESGLRCVAPAREAPERGESVDLELELSGEPPLVGRGSVVRRVERDRSQAELGIGFTLVEAERIEDLRRFVFAEQLRRRRANA